MLAGSEGPPNLIDSSFFGVYTDPSKPPVICDLAGFYKPVPGLSRRPFFRAGTIFKRAAAISGSEVSNLIVQQFSWQHAWKATSRGMRWDVRFDW